SPPQPAGRVSPAARWLAPPRSRGPPRGAPRAAPGRDPPGAIDVPAAALAPSRPDRAASGDAALSGHRTRTPPRPVLHSGTRPSFPPRLGRAHARPGEG